MFGCLEGLKTYQYRCSNKYGKRNYSQLWMCSTMPKRLKPLIHILHFKIIIIIIIIFRGFELPWHLILFEFHFNPGPQLQEYVPSVLTQAPSLLQVCDPVLHSSSSWREIKTKSKLYFALQFWQIEILFGKSAVSRLIWFIMKNWYHWSLIKTSTISPRLTPVTYAWKTIASVSCNALAQVRTISVRTSSQTGAIISVWATFVNIW